MRTGGILLLMLLLTGCSSGPKIHSAFSDGTIIIDGNPKEWQSDLVFLKDQGLDVGIRHDRQNLYLCLLPVESDLAARILLQGVTLWFDSSAGEKKVHGIRLPVHAAGKGGPQSSPAMDQQSGERPQMNRQAGQRPQLDEIARNMDLETIHYRILETPGSGGIEHSPSPEGRAPRIGMQVGKSRIALEIQIPLGECSDSPFAFTPGPEGKFSLGIQVPVMRTGPEDGPMTPPKRPGGGMRSGGGMGGGGGMRPGGMGGGPPGERSDDALEIWIQSSVNLTLGLQTETND